MDTSVIARRTGLSPALRDPVLIALLEDSSQAVSLLDRDGLLLYANDVLCETHGFSAATAVGQHLGDIAPDLWDQLEPELGSVKDGRDLEGEHTSSRADCPLVVREWSDRWQAVRDDHGDIIAILGISVDVTEHHAEREEQERLADLRGRLIETASHELRGPLASVLGFAHRLTRDEHLSPQAAEAAELIREQAQELAFRLDLFLGVSELDDPRGLLHSPASPSMEDVLVDDLLEREAEAMRARRPGIDLAVHCPPGLTISSNPHYIRQILSNLLDNAAKYGSGWIGVSAERGERHLVVRVEDDGDGIAPEDQAQVFRRGYRAASARTASTGRGLGLFVAREFAERLGGALTLRSEAGVGTIFLLRVPLQAPRRRRRRVTVRS